MRHALSVNGTFLGTFQLLVLLYVVDELAIWIVTGVEMRTVPEGLVSILVYDSAEVLLIAVGVSLSLLALISRAVVAILQVLLGFELKSFDLI